MDANTNQAATAGAQAQALNVAGNRRGLIVKYSRAAVLDFIIAYKRANDGLSPTIREIGDACNIPSISTVAYILTALQLTGKIAVADGARGIKVTGGHWEITSGEQGDGTK